MAVDSAQAGVRLPNVLSDHMVLQQNTEVTLWGWASVGNTIDVETSWGVKAEAYAQPDGSWAVKIKTPAATPLGEGLHPQTITITMPQENMLQIRDILIGEVWLCSGQSNMEMMLRPGYPPGWNGWYGEAFWKNNESKKADRPYLRVFDVEKTASAQPQTDVKGFLPTKALQPENDQGFIPPVKMGWQPCTPQTAEYFSAVAYYFGADLAEKLRVPVGLITSDVGGTQIQSWMKDGIYYNGMIAPFFPMTIKGVIWYQGESNVGGPTGAYAHLFPDMIQNWRENFHQPDMPFYFVQIAPYGNNPASPELRQEQATALGLKNTGMVVTSDLGDPNQIHPKDKRDVGRRLARQALCKTYGRSDVIADGPTFQSLKWENGKIHIAFSNSDGGLASRDRKPLTCFAMSGLDGKFIPVAAKIVHGEVVISCPAGLQPTELQFDWGASDDPNLISTSGLPAAQFQATIK